MKKKFSKILAMLCALAMVVNTIGIQSLAETSPQTASLTEITFTDFGIADDTYAGVGGTYNNAATLVGTKISGYVTLNEDLKDAVGDAWLSFGYNTWGGLMFYFKPDGSMHVNTGSVAASNAYNYVIDPANISSLNGKKFYETRFKLTLSLEAANLDSDNNQDDVLLKVYINDEPAVANPTGNDALYGSNGEYYILDKIDTHLQGYLITQQIGIGAGYCSDITLESYVPELTKLTFTDFGLAEDTYTFVRGTYNEGASLVGTQFSSNITLNEDLKSASAGAWLVLGGTSGLPDSYWDGVQIQFEPDGKTVKINQGSVTNTNPYAYVFSADSNEGLTTFAGEQFKLTVSFEPANLNNGSAKDDILVKLYINDNLWVANDTGNAALYGENGSYYILDAKTENMQGYLAVQQIGAQGLCSDITFGSISESENPGDDDIPTELAEIKFSDFGLDDGTYTFVRGTYNEGASLMGKSLSGYVTLNEDLKSASAGAWLVLGGTSGLPDSYWDGVQIQFEPDGKTVKINQGSVTNTNPYAYVFSADSNEGLTTFAGEQFKLTVSFEPANLNNGSAKDDILVKLYINDNLWVANDTGNAALYGENGSYYILDAKTENMQGYLAVQQIGAQGLCSDITFATKQDLKELTFTDFGLIDNTYTYVRGTYNEGATLVGTEVSGYITLNEDLTNASTGAWLVLGGTAGLPSSSWDGVQLWFEPDGKTVKLNQASVTDANPYMYTYSADNNVGVTTFAGQKVKIKVVFEPANLDNGSTDNDILVKLYMNDNLWVANDTGNATLYGENGSYYILNAKTENMLGYFAVQQINGSGLCSDIILGSVGEDAEDPDNPGGPDNPDNPDNPQGPTVPAEPTDLEDLTFIDFNLVDNEYTYVRGTHNNGATLVGTKVSGYLTLNQDLTSATTPVYAVLGGTNGLASSGWDGIQLLFEPDGKTVKLSQGPITDTNQYQYTYRAENNEGVTTFAGEKVKVTVSLAPANLDDGTEENDLVVRLYINDNLWVPEATGNEALYGKDGALFVFNAKADNLQGFFAVQQIGTEGCCSSVILGSIGGAPQGPEDMAIPEEPKNLTDLTFIDFGLADNRYTSAKGTYNDGASLVGAQVSGYVTLNKDLANAAVPVYVVLGGTQGLADSGWDGVQLIFDPDGKTVKLSQGSLTDTNPYQYVYRAENNEGLTTFAGEKVKVKVTFAPANLDNGAEEDDVVLRLYINDKLWVPEATGNEALYGKDGALFVLNAKKDNLQGFFAVNQIGVEGFCSDIILESVDGRGKETIVKPALHKVTLGQLGIAAALYKYNNNDLVTSGTYADTLMNSVFATKITFSKHDGNRIMYGGKPSAWHGINFTAHANGNIMIHPGEGEFPETYWLTPEVAGTTLVGEEIDLKIELFKSGKNAKLGVYINGELYDGSYFHLSGAADAFGNYVGFYVADEKGSIKIGVPEPTPVVNKDFKQLTFDSYDIETGTYSYDVLGLAASGHCGLESLDKVVFSDTVQFSKAVGASLRIGGKPSAWHGLVLSNTEDGKLVLNEAEGKMPAIYFDPATAGTALVGEDIKLQLSFEYVDSDEDGKKDDVKLGVWFNGKSYGDRWFYLQDIAEVLGGYLSIYCANEDAYLKVYTYHVPIDYTIWGFTKRWAYELGLRKRR